MNLIQFIWREWKVPLSLSALSLLMVIGALVFIYVITYD